MSAQNAPQRGHSAESVVACTFVMWRGWYTGNSVGCGVCPTCNDQGLVNDLENGRLAPCPEHDVEAGT